MGTENYVIEFFSNEWIINTSVSLVVILTLLLIGRISSYNQRLNLAKAIAVLLIIFTLTEHSRNIINGYWNISENLPLHLCGISNLIADKVTLGGLVKGEVAANTLNVSSSARVEGNLKTNSLSIDLGAEVAGNISRIS